MERRLNHSLNFSHMAQCGRFLIILLYKNMLTYLLDYHRHPAPFAYSARVRSAKAADLFTQHVD
jgi:hypothetical protein